MLAVVIEKLKLPSFAGQRYKGSFICDGDELNIHECRPSLYRTTKCDTGDLVLFCDRG